MSSYNLMLANPDIIDISTDGPIFSFGSITSTIQADAVVEEVCASATDLSQTYQTIEKAVNTYLLQFEPIYVVAAVILGITIAYIVLPRLPYILMSMILFVKLVDDIYAFHKDGLAFKHINEQMPYYSRFLFFGGLYMYCVGEWLK